MSSANSHTADVTCKRIDCGPVFVQWGAILCQIYTEVLCTKSLHVLLIVVWLFAAAGAMAALQSKRDGLQRRVEGLIKCKTEFQELAKCL